MTSSEQRTVAAKKFFATDPRVVRGANNGEEDDQPAPHPRSAAPLRFCLRRDLAPLVITYKTLMPSLPGLPKSSRCLIHSWTLPTHGRFCVRAWHGMLNTTC